MADSDFYRCFLCDTNQKNEQDFLAHLKSMDHVECLVKRNLLSAEHFEILVRIHHFSFLDNPTSEYSNHNPLVASLYEDRTNESLPSLNDSAVSVTPKRTSKKKSDVSAAGSGDAAYTSREGAQQAFQVKSKSAQGKASVPGKKEKPPSFHCNLCGMSVIGKSSLIQHQNGKRHMANVKSGDDESQMNRFRCNTCMATFEFANILISHVGKCKIAVNLNGDS